MKITILQGAFLPVPPVLGGAVEKMWYALGKEFSGKGHEVVHISREYSSMPSEERDEGVLYKRIRGYDTPSSGILHLKWLDYLYSLRAVSVVPPDSDIILTNTFWAPLVLPKYLRKRCVVDVQRMPKGQMKLYYQSFRLRANSGPVARAIKEEIPSGQHHRVMLVPNPLPFQNMPEVDLKSKKPILLYVGRVHPEKGLEILIKAFKRLDAAEDWELKIVGGAERETGGGGFSYLKSLKKLAGRSKVEFTGPVYDMDLLNKYYAEASVFVYPSVAEQGETFGLAPLEAMAWGCVPVVSGLACFQDFVNHGKNGLIYDHRNKEAAGLLKEAISCLIQYSFYRSRLAENALEVRNSHSTAFLASHFLEEFEKIADGQKTPEPVMI